MFTSCCTGETHPPIIITVNHQSQLPLYEEFLGRSAKLESQLKATGLTFGAFLDTAQKIADSASKSKGSEKLSILPNSISTATLYS